ncbi:MAG: NUDIX domain-containing protein [Sandaracinaceae bacterium]|nr:NUDIX domain-containing protein [Sandaracinaceae bacterium]
MIEARFCLRCGAALEKRLTEERERLACPSCAFVFYDNPLPVVAAIVEHEGEVVLVRQHGWPDKWLGIVTGFLERGETPEQGILREVKEELGLGGEVVSLVGAYAFPQRNEIIIAYHVRASGEIVLGAELERFKKVAIDKLQPWPFGTGLAVRDWLARRHAAA